MNGWRKVWTGFMVLVFLAGGSLAPAGLHAAQADQPAATPPYQDWYEVVSRPVSQASAITVYRGLVYAAVDQRLAAFEPTTLNSLEKVGHSAPLNQIPAALAGRGDYLYAATGQGSLYTFSLANPRSPVLIHTAAISSSASRLLATPNHLVIGYYSTVQLVNLGNPAAPAPGSMVSTGAIDDIANDGNNLYVASYTNLKWINLASLSPVSQTVYTSTDALYRLGTANGVALLTRWRDMLVLNLSNPASPQLTAEITDTIYGGEGVVISGGHAYAASGGALYVINLTNPAQPRLLSSRHLAGELAADDTNLILDGGLVYFTHPRRGIAQVDISQPVQPAVKAFWGFPTYSAMTRQGNRLYAASSLGRLEIFDLSDPDRPVILGQLPTQGTISKIRVQGGLAVLTGWARTNLPNVFVDVNDPGNPRVISTLTYNPGLYDIALNGSYAYAAASNSVQIVNLTNPYNPQIAGSLAASGPLSNLVVQDGKLFFAEKSNKILKIYSLANPLVPALLGSTTVDFQSAYLTANGVAVYNQYVLVHSGSSVAVVNAQNPSSPTQAAFFDNVASDSGNMVVAGQQVFLGGNSGNVYAVDLSNPLNPLVSERADLTAWSAFGGAASSDRLYLAADDFLSLRTFPAVVRYINDSNYNQALTLNSPQDGVTYSFMPYSFSSFGGSYFSHAILTNDFVPSATGGMVRIAPVFRNGHSGYYSSSYQFSMTYSDAQIAGLSEASLRLYYWNGSSWAAEASSAVNAASNTLTASPAQTGTWMVAGTPVASVEDTTTIRLPLIVRAQSIDLALSDLEITQAVQDSENSLPLVQNRLAVLRVKASTTQPGGTHGVYLSVAASRNGQALPGSPLTSGPWTLFTSAGRGIFETTPYVQLPQDWLSGSVSLTVSLDPANQISETNEGNNTLTRGLTFQAVPPLHIVIVPVRYTHTPTGQVFDPPGHDSISWHNMEVYPVPGLTVEMHAPINFSGNLPTSSSWSALLNTVTSLKNSEGRPRGIVYYAVVSKKIFTGYGSFIAGIGWLGLRASTGWNDYHTMAHEVGHNFDLEHTFSDPAYPYSHDRLGELGFNVFSRAVYPADFYADLMSYNNNATWISDYYYLHVFNDQRRNGATALSDTARERVLLVSGTVTPEGSVDILPVYSLPDLASRPSADGPFQIALLAVDGRELARHAVEVFWMADEEDHDPGKATPGRFDSILPLPDEPVATVRIYQGETLLAERTLQSGGAASLASEAALIEGGAELTWLDDGQPVLVRASWDGGQTWQVLAVDWLGGRLRIEPEGLPEGRLRVQVIPADRGWLEADNLPFTEVDLGR